MYVNIAGSPNNKDVYIYHSFRKENKKFHLAFTKTWEIERPHRSLQR